VIGQTISHYKSQNCPRLPAVDFGRQECFLRVVVIFRIRHLLGGGVAYDRADYIALQGSAEIGRRWHGHRVQSRGHQAQAHRCSETSPSIQPDITQINHVEEVVMKKLNHVAWFALCLAPFFSSCQTKVDVEKEREAIKAVLEQEKKGFFDKNFEMMAATWVQKPSSVKMYMSQDGEIDLFGWAKISEGDKEGVAKDRSDYKNMQLEFSDFQFNIYESNAWAIFKAQWNWTYKDTPGKLEQTRIMALEKVEGKWKITLMAIYNVPAEKEEARKKTEKGSK
jgi:hypothetical protein